MKKGLKAQDVEVVNVKVAIEEMPIVCEPIEKKRRPRTGYEAKFSIPYTVALCLTTGKHGLSEFDDESLLTRMDMLELCDRVVCEVDNEADFPRHFSSDVTVKLKNGKTMHHREELNRGCVDRPLSPADICGKFMENARLTMNQNKATELMNIILNLEKIHRVSDLVGLVVKTNSR